MPTGAFHTQEYPNFFSRIGVSAEEALARVQACFETIFFDPEEGFYHDVDADSACLEDTATMTPAPRG